MTNNTLLTVLAVSAAAVWSLVLHTEWRIWLRTSRKTDAHLENTDDRIRSLARRVDLSEQELREINRFIRAERQREEISE